MCGERHLQSSHIWPGGSWQCDPSQCLLAAKWRSWRAAEEDIIQCLIILSSHNVPCVGGVSEVEGDSDQTSGVTRCANEWTMAIHQSSMPACLTAWNQLQCPFQSNLIYSADSFISLTSFAILTGFLKRVGFKGKDEGKILNLREPMTTSPKYCLEHSRWAMSFISVPRWLIYLVDGLFISQPKQTCMCVAAGKFRGVLFSCAVEQPCTSPSASWPHWVIRT